MYQPNIISQLFLFSIFQALLLAMTLHEKGKAALTRFEYGDALLLLTEADEQFV